MGQFVCKQPGDPLLLRVHRFVQGKGIVVLSWACSLHVFSDQCWETGARRVKLMLHLVLNVKKKKSEELIICCWLDLCFTNLRL